MHDACEIPSYTKVLQVIYACVLTAHISRLMLKISCTESKFVGGEGQQKSDNQWQDGSERCCSAARRDVGEFGIVHVKHRIVEDGRIEAWKAQCDDIFVSMFASSLFAFSMFAWS